MRELAFFDTETTGLIADVHEIIEVGVKRIAFEPGKNWRATWRVLGEYTTLVRPELGEIPEKIKNIVRVKDEEWVSAVSLENALYNVLPLLDGAQQVGSKPQFDFNFLEAACKTVGREMPRFSSHHPIDVGSMAMKLVLLGEIPDIRQRYLAEKFCSGAQTHRAMDDVNQSIDIFLKLMM